MKAHLYNPSIKYLPQIVANPDEVDFLVIDLFCGAGGTSTGFLQAKGKALVIACINHDAKAIESHWLNHPEVLHFEEDIRTVELSPLVSLLAQYKTIYPNAKVILWASLECTNFSKAKGGQARDADSRTLA
ncbi:MAG: DNA cytosine methyltransferase [Chryseobacterium sp.]|nr:MAG: DNA cytosine methyltransferase [Chryseobacterium sp.]